MRQSGRSKGREACPVLKQSSLTSETAYWAVSGAICYYRCIREAILRALGESAVRADAQRTNPQVKTGDEVEDMSFMEKMPGGGSFTA